MTRDQQSVIWIGLILIALNLVVNRAQVKATIFNKGGPTGDASKTTPPSIPPKGPSTPSVAPGPMNPIYGGNGNVPQNTPPSVMVV